MPERVVPLAKLSLVYTRTDTARSGHDIALSRIILWGGGMVVAALFYFGGPAFFNWKHVISSSGGHYFPHRVQLPVPVFTQDDPRWSFQLLGPTYETIGQSGCAVTSAAMVLSAYGVDTDPQRLNDFLNQNGGYTPNGWLYWERRRRLRRADRLRRLTRICRPTR